MTMEHEVRYCASVDGTTIGYIYNDVGREPPIVFVTHSLIPVESQTLHHTVAESFPIVVATGRRFLYFDRRGIGYSQREVSEITEANQVTDLASVLSHVRLAEFDLVGLGDGCAVAAAHAVLHPEGMRRLALVQPIAGQKPEGLSELMRGNWGLGRRAIVDFSLGDLPAELRRAHVDCLRRTVTPDVASRYLDIGFDWRPGRELGSIEAPTLVVQPGRSQGGAVDRARSLAAMIPGARLVTVKGQVSDVLRAFLEGDELAPAEVTAPLAGEVAPGALRTVLFTDLVGHTEMMSRLGDERGRDILREHERITRECLAAHGGAEVKTMGDGFMASFGSVTKAVECAVALQRAFDERNTPVGAQLGDGGGAGSAAPNDAAMPNQPVEPLSVRVGLNAGEPIEEDGDLFGATVILASRIAAKAEGGEILVADTVRGLCSGKGFLFADRGEFVAKGFEEPVRVYEVSWRDG
jgi:class 3 adenylate cyclase